MPMFKLQASAKNWSTRAKELITQECHLRQGVSAWHGVDKVQRQGVWGTGVDKE